MQSPSMASSTGYGAGSSSHVDAPGSTARLSPKTPPSVASGASPQQQIEKKVTSVFVSRSVKKLATCVSSSTDLEDEALHLLALAAEGFVRSCARRSYEVKNRLNSYKRERMGVPLAPHPSVALMAPVGSPVLKDGDGGGSGSGGGVGSGGASGSGSGSGRGSGSGSGNRGGSGSQSGAKGDGGASDYLSSVRGSGGSSGGVLSGTDSGVSSARGSGSGGSNDSSNNSSGVSSAAYNPLLKPEEQTNLARAAAASLASPSPPPVERLGPRGGSLRRGEVVEKIQMSDFLATVFTASELDFLREEIGRA